MLFHACLFMPFPVCSFFTLPSLPGKLLLFLLISFQASSLLWEVSDSFRQTRGFFSLCFYRTSQPYTLSEWTLMVSKPSELGTPSSQRKFDLSLDLRTQGGLNRGWRRLRMYAPCYHGPGAYSSALALADRAGCALQEQGPSSGQVREYRHVMFKKKCKWEAGS